jgi:hypothetical protein
VRYLKILYYYYYYYYIRQNYDKRAEKILHYKDLTTEIQPMWNVKTKVLGVITGGNWNHHPKNI